MGSFDTPLDLRYLDGQEWELLAPFTYHHTTGDILVPAGFRTDFASIPRFFWRLLPPTGKYGKAAVVHDGIYRTPTMPYTRKAADGIFLDAMKDLGVGLFTRRLMWAGVRAGGSGAYKPRTVLPNV